jgi:1,4-dihydroxy-2-naphthoate octaprenyltransferase
VLPVASVLVALSFPVLVRVWRTYDLPKPAESPMPNPVWPLWFAAHSFVLTRRAGGLFVIGLVIGAIVGW